MPLLYQLYEVTKQNDTMPIMKSWTTQEPEEQKQVIEEILKGIETTEGALVLALHGQLGAGKTTFVQNLASVLGVQEIVTSPTFVIQKNYQLPEEKGRLVHIDAYRIDEIDELKVLGFESLLTENDTIICIEWAERVADILPETTVNLYFSEKDGTHVIEQQI